MKNARQVCMVKDAGELHFSSMKGTIVVGKLFIIPSYVTQLLIMNFHVYGNLQYAKVHNKIRVHKMMLYPMKTTYQDINEIFPLLLNSDDSNPFNSHNSYKLFCAFL